MYISLHNRSAYSFGTALTTPVQLAAFAHAQRMPAIALTDLHGLYAAVEFQKECRKAGVKPIFGAEMTPTDSPPVTLLAQTLKGYGHLCKLISRHHLQGIGLSDLAEHAEDLICLSHSPTFPLAHPSHQTPPSPVTGLNGRAGLSQFSILNSQLSSRHSHFSLLTSHFPHRLYVALTIHSPADVPLARRRAAWADAHHIPVVATCASRCLHSEQKKGSGSFCAQHPKGRSGKTNLTPFSSLALRALASIGTLTLLDRPHPDKPEGVWHLRTPAEMDRLFRRRPDALANTLRIAEQCNVTLDLNRDRFPAFVSPDGRSAMEHLRELCTAGCRRRYLEQPQQKGIGGRRPTLAEALQRLERELTIIDQVHYAEYFLVFHEIVEHCRAEGIATLARGSAADSLVCYALGVSHACPFRFDLPFDRFLNPERAKFSKMADIDLDLPWDRRDEVIRWVYERWGSDRVAMIGSPNTFHARAAVAELGKVFGLPAHEVHRISKRLPHSSVRHLPQYLASSPEARDLPIHEEPYRTILNIALDLDGLPRHWAMHPCGLVVAPEPLTDLVPVQPSPRGPLVAQYDMDAIEALGFIKIDLLGQAGLSVLRDTVAEIERTTGRHIDLERDVDYSDAPTWDLIAGGQARGVHHIESPAMTSLLQQSSCRDIDCLTTIVAIIRPGAANQGSKEVFARRHAGLEPPTYAHPSLQPILEKTYGLMIFEEHILQIATEFASLNLGEADVLRRALNKQNQAMILDMGAKFVDSALRSGRSPQEIRAVWSHLAAFSGFMFNKAHSAEYAVEAFQGAWLKQRWPAHYLAAILSNYRGFYAHSPTLPQILYVLEALRRGIHFLPPCVNRSRPRFSVERACDEHGTRRDHRDELELREDAEQSTIRNPQSAIRIPIAHINGLSESFLERYLPERARGPFTSLNDFLARCRPGEAESLSLLDAGALDSLGTSRPELFWRLRKLLRHPQSSGLFSAPASAHEAPPLELTVPDARRMAGRETELLGFPLTLHPLDYLGADDQGRRIDWSRYTPVNQLTNYANRRVHVCGLMVADRIGGTLNGKRGGSILCAAPEGPFRQNGPDPFSAGQLMKFVTLADYTGFVETILFPDAYQRFGHLTVAHPILAATGIVEPFATGTGFTLRVQNIRSPAMVEGGR